MKYSKVDRLKAVLGGAESGGGSRLARNTALVTGSMALTALALRAVVRRARPDGMIAPADLEPALEAEIGDLEIMEGRTRFYHRPGYGTPIVLLHDVHLTGSSFDWLPLFDHLTTTTSRPIYAVDWIGFGISDRPPVNYHPGLFQRQLRRFLSEKVGHPSDIIAAGPAAEYAAAVLNAFPVLGRRLAFIAPTGLAAGETRSVMRQVTFAAAGATGLFEPAYFRMTAPEALRRYFESDILSRGAKIPDELLEYARRSSKVTGAHHAVRRSVEGALQMGEYALRAYERLTLPALLVLPVGARETVRRFDLAGQTEVRSKGLMRIVTVPGGLMPQWEHLEKLVEALQYLLEDAS
jgi:pimeloyl-ACP methyl ester carboxylesterase